MSAHLRQINLHNLSRSYYELNGSTFETWERPPTALEFSQIVHIARPVIFKGVSFPALYRLTDDYLIQAMGDKPMSVAVTPNGRADAVTRDSNDLEYFVEPLSEEMTMDNLLSKLKGGESSSEVYYLQSQNGNIYDSQFFSDGASPSEYISLCQDVPAEVSWCSEALGRQPDAVNLWIGDAKSITSIHSDPYENIYTVVRGTKHFTLLPPTDGWSLEERVYPHAKYTRADNGRLVITPSECTPPIRWSSVAGPHIDGNLHPDVHPIHVNLEVGDTLYLPAGWWHHVRQGGEHGELTIAINWWYDMEMRGMGWVWLSFLRDMPEIIEEEEGI